MSKRRNRAIGSAQISEFAAVLAVFFLILLLPLINFFSLTTAYATAFLAARQSAMRAGDATNFNEALESAEAGVREVTGSGLGQFAALKPVGGYNNSGMNLYVTDTNYSTNASISHGPNTPAVSEIDADRYFYSYDAVVTFDAGPMLNLQSVPFIGNVVGLGKPVRITFEANRAIEHLDGLTAGGGGFVTTGGIITSDTHAILGPIASSGGVDSGYSAASSGTSVANGSTRSFELAGSPRRPWQVASTNGVTRNIPNALSSFHVQLTGEVDFSNVVDVMETDLFETNAADVATIHNNGGYAIAYFNGGAWQPGMPDSGDYPPSVIGKQPMAGWPEERWLDIRQIEVLRPIIQAKMQVAKSKGFDAVDADNMDGFTNTNEFNLTAQDQVLFDQMVAEEAHKVGLAIMLKNTGSLMSDLVNDFDGTVAEQAYRYNEAEIYQPMRDSGKPVFLIEYKKPAKKNIQDAVDRGFNMIQAKKALKGKTKMLTPS